MTRRNPERRQRWRRRHYSDTRHLEEILRERSPSGPEPTMEEDYWDSGVAQDQPEDWPPWLDSSSKREKEL